MTILYSKTYISEPQKGTGLDQLLLVRGPWEERDILIHGISLTHRVWPRDPNAFACAGSSFSAGDILGHVGGGGATNIMYPRPFFFPARPAPFHVDVHAWAQAHRHECCLTIYYTQADATTKEWDFYGIGDCENDLMPYVAVGVYAPIEPVVPLNWKGRLHRRWRELRGLA